MDVFAAGAAERRPPVSEGTDSRTLIFLVDDDPILGRFVRKSLELDGFEVREFLRGEEFLEALRVDVPDLVLLDLRMPSLSGEVILERLRADPPASPIRILLYSSSDPEHLERLCEEHGADGYVTKTTPAEGLGQAIESALAKPPRFGA